MYDRASGIVVARVTPQGAVIDSDIYGNIDIEISINEEITQEIPYILPSIISGGLILDNRSKVVVYDVMG